LNAEPASYAAPIFYIMGEDDWQTPATLAQDHFTRILAPSKEFFVIPHAGHLTIVDQPAQFFDVLAEIKRYRATRTKVPSDYGLSYPNMCVSDPSHRSSMAITVRALASKLASS
jgi:hypothetical protein